jgi:hypothetical protein
LVCDVYVCGQPHNAYKFYQHISEYLLGLGSNDSIVDAWKRSI